MTLIRVAPFILIALLGIATGATAQFAPTPQFGPAPQYSPAPAPQPAPNPCMASFVPLRQEAEKRAGTLKAAAAKKIARPEMCQLFRRFTEAEAKVVKFVTDNQAACGVPPQAVVEMKANHGKSLQIQAKVCAADGPEGKPRGPGLGEALGVRAVPTPETTPTGKGIFDTLSGTPLAP